MPEAHYDAEATEEMFGAIAKGDIAKALRALEEGANPNATQGEMKNSPLMLCALYHNPLVAKALLEKGADPDYARRGGDTALIMTAFSNDRATAKAIVDAGANILKQNNSNQDAMMRAHSEGNHTMAPMFRQWADERVERIAHREADERLRQNIADIVATTENGLNTSVQVRGPLKLRFTHD
ncbi:MAG: ankyrin repeat domain-containing protein [Alphaproteobacteria bacterium]|nr:MAG: ankyrin repeat domain-containing protein [Alphaproteobacteria bacterium]